MTSASPQSHEPPPPGRPPTFLFIGGQRCASNWIYRCLSEHPEVHTPEGADLAIQGEIHYFDNHFDKGPEWYCRHFQPGPEHRAWGEKTPDYLSVPEVAGRIREMLPEVRLLCCLREPGDRAYSRYQGKRYGEGYASFEDAIASDESLLVMGRYAEHLRRWFDLFPREQILVLLYDELWRNEARFIRQIYAHVGVDDGYRPSWLGKKTNAVVFPRLRHRLRQMGLEPVVRTVAKTPIGAAVRSWNRNRVKPAYEAMSDRVRTMLDEYFQQPNRELEQLLGVDLSAWRPRREPRA